MKRYKMMFMSPDGDVTGGEEEVSRGTAIFEKIENEDGKGSGPEGAETKKEEKVETPPAPVVDAAALAEKFGTVIAEHFKKEEPKVEEKKFDDLTSDEAKKLLNVWEPTKEWQARFDNLETREAALAELRDGVVKHTDSITKLRVKEALDPLRAEVEPLRQFMRDYQNEQAEKRLVKQYPDLAKEGMDTLISAVSNGLVTAGKKFKTEDELFGAIATGVESVIKIHDPKFKLSTGSNPAKTKTKPANAIPVTTSGSGGGTGGGGGEGPAKSRGLAIFD